jgi:hypothetical protein
MSDLLCAVRPEYKKVSELRPHCPHCKERLAGNNSIALPYRCSCGVWKYNNLIDERALTFTIEAV